MNRLPHLIAAGLLAAGLLVLSPVRSSGADERPGARQPDAQNTEHATAVAQIQGAGDHKDKIKGTVTFMQTQDAVKVLVDVTGLTPGKHGFHIHEKADLSDPKLTSAGPHWNPEGHKHGAPDHGDHHAGDLGNITADDSGHAKTELTVKGISVSREKNGVVGHSVIIHDKEDDMKTDPSGNSGDRIAGGAIEAQTTKK